MDNPTSTNRRRQLIQAGGALAGASALGFPYLALGAAEDHPHRLRFAADRAAGPVRRGGQLHAEPDPRAAQGRVDHRRHQVRRRDPGQGLAVQPESRRRSGGRSDPEGQDQPDAGRQHARDGQPGQRPMRAERGALRVQPRALAAVVLRAQGRSRQGLRLDLPLLLGAGGRHRGVHQHVEDAADQQESRRPVPQRRRRQRLGRQGTRLPEAACRRGLHAVRSGPLSEPHAGLLRPDRRLQEGQRRHHHRRGAAAGHEDVLDPGQAAGPQAQDRVGRQGAAVPRRGGSHGRPGRRLLDRGVVDADVSLYVVAHQAKREAVGRRIRGHDQEAMDAADRLRSRAVRGRASTRSSAART